MKDNYQAESDARTLQSAAEIHGDPKRHKAAHAHLSKMAAATKLAHKQSAKHLHQKVKKGLAAAFPEPNSQDEQRDPMAEGQNNDTSSVEGD